MNKVGFSERKKPAVKQANYGIGMTFDGVTESVSTFSDFLPAKSSQYRRKRTAYVQGRYGTRCRKPAHNPRPRTTGVGPATINFVINPSRWLNVVDIVTNIRFRRGFSVFKKGLQDE